MKNSPLTLEAKDVTVTDTVNMGANESTVTVAKEATLADEVIDDPVQPSDNEPTLADKVLPSDMEVVESLQPSNNEVVEPVVQEGSEQDPNDKADMETGQ